MRSLFVIHPGSPLPIQSGGSLRYWNLLRSLRDLGEVDVWLMNEPDPARRELLCAALDGGRVHADTPVVRQWSPRSDVEWLLRSRLPRWPEFEMTGARARFESWRAPAYDVVLSADAMCHQLLSQHVAGRQIIDLGDVPDRTYERELRFDARQAGVKVIQPRTAYRLVRGAENLRRYRKLQQRLRDDDIDLLTCSEADRAHLGGGEHVLVVPNG